MREVLRCDPGKLAECATIFEANDPMFAGHFPGNPMVPGVILTEALAQTAGIAGASGTAKEKSAPKFLLSAIRQMKFPSAARPNERIMLRAELSGCVGNLWQFAVSASVDGREVAAGQIVLNAVG